jgi:AraC-like DNA-binding protein
LELKPSSAKIHAELGEALSPDLPSTPGTFGFLFFWAGRGTLRLDEQRLSLRPGVVVIARAGQQCQTEQSLTQRLGLTAIHFTLLDETGAPLRDDAELPPPMFDVSNVPYVDAVTRRVVELLKPATNGGDNEGSRDTTVAEQLFGALLRDLDQEQVADDAVPGTERRHTQLASEAASRINESPQDAPSLEELSQHAGYTKDHFARVFKKVVGQTPHDYLINARVRRARQMLVESNLSIKEIASALGYRDIYFFSRQFKAKMGITPSEARRRGVMR